MADDFDVAIVGMAGRFPGAANLAEFWSNLAGGVESIARLSDAELSAAGVPAEVLHRADYVKAAPVLDDPAKFDAAFFGYAPGEAARLDPQQRVALELAQVALDDAGCDPARFAGRIGVFAGSAMNTYFFNRGLDDQFAENYIPTLVATDKDFLATRISYKLGLRGPSLTVQTACSTSLVAVHLARQSLLSEETDLAVAAAVSVRVPHQAGYFYDGSGVVSPDGHVRAFDDAANGTVFGSGAGVVVLKRLADARAQGDRIYAVLKGSAVNNDGASKAGFTAPSVGGQAEAIVEALANSGLSAEDLSYVEAHGSGTPVGDRIELLALTQAFRQFTPRTGFCAIGSVKTNVGHLDAAAGMAGLIKTVLALRHQRLPATLNFSRPNAEIDFASTPFVVAAQARDWTENQESPRRAAILATGMGGTNACVILEAAPEVERVVPNAPDAAHATEPAHPELLVWSAKTAAAVNELTAALARVEAPLAGWAHTLQTGRREWAERRCLVARDAADGRRELANAQSARVIAGSVRSETAGATVFLLPGIGDHYVGMGRGLYETIPFYRAQVDRCAEILRPLIGTDLRELLFAASAPAASAGIDLKRMLGRGPESRSPAELKLDETRYSQPALFVTEYALARLWMECGVQPAYLVGHSMGEYVAAGLAGVFSLEDALRLIATRAKLVQELPPASMLAVMLGEADLLPLLGPELSISLINGPKLCVVAGPDAALAALQERLKAQSTLFRPVRNGHAFHSRLLDPVVEPFVNAVRTIRLSTPRLPFLSNVTGTWITPEQATDPRYWGEHLRRTARFSDGLAQLAQLPNPSLVEVGPGRTLGVLVSQHPAWPATNRPLTVASLRHSYENYADAEVWLGSVGRLWVKGAAIAWEKVRAGRAPMTKVSLPAYPFDRQRHWLDRSVPVSAVAAPHSGVGFYVPAWHRAGSCAATGTMPVGVWLLAGGSREESTHWLQNLQAAGRDVLALPPEEVIRLEVMRERAGAGLNLVYLDTGDERSFYRLLALAQACAEQLPATPIKLAVITTGAQDVTGGETLHPGGALATGLAGVIARELTNVTAVAIDRLPGEDVVAAVAGELAQPSGEAIVALRGRFRWVRRFERAPDVLLGSSAWGTTRSTGASLRSRGVYLITGGTSGIGAELALDLARRCQARVVLLSRRGSTPDLAAAVKAAGGEAMIEACDVADPVAVRRVVAAAQERFGPLHGVVHAAGVIDDGMLQLKTPAAAAAVLRPKVGGVTVLQAALSGLALDWIVAFSSISAVTPRHGQGDYGAANAFLDTWAAATDRPGATRVRSINWPGWREVGIFSRLTAQPGQEAQHAAERERALSTADGLEAFYRALEIDASQVVVSPVPPERWAGVEGTAGGLGTTRPTLVAPSATEAPQDEVEKAVAEIWGAALGIESVGRSASFLDLGGHSLLAMRIVAQIRTAYQIDFTLRKFFEHPTVAQMAAAIQAEIMAEIEALSDDEATQRTS